MSVLGTRRSLAFQFTMVADPMAANPEEREERRRESDGVMYCNVCASVVAGNCHWVRVLLQRGASFRRPPSLAFIALQHPLQALGAANVSAHKQLAWIVCDHDIESLDAIDVDALPAVVREIQILFVKTKATANALWLSLRCARYRSRVPKELAAHMARIVWDARKNA